MKTELRKILNIAYYTFREILKSKILINTFFLGLLLLLLTYIASQFTYGVAYKVTIDLGLSFLTISAVGISIFMGATLVAKEIESRTIYMIVSRPVSRSSFLIGKLLGLTGIVFINILILSTTTLLLFFITGGSFSSIIGWTILFTFAESILVLFIVVFFSLLTNTTLSVMYTIVIYGLGYAVAEAKTTSMFKLMPALRYFIEGYELIFPMFYKLNLKDFIIYGSSPSFGTLAANLFYAIFYVTFLTVVMAIIFERKSLD